MKKLCLMAFSLLAVRASLAAFSIDLYGVASVKADLKGMSNEKTQQNIVGLESAVGGVKVIVPCFDGRFYWNGKDFSYGLAFNSERLNKMFPIQAKWGKLSSGGGLSKLNNPLISSSISPFLSATTTINPVTATLSSSFNKSDTLFFQAGYKNDFVKNAIVNCLYDPNGDLFSPLGNVALSSLVALELPKKMKLSSEITFGSFAYKGLESSSWYNESRFYHDGRQNSAIAQILFSKDVFSSILSGGFYASPFGDLKTIWKSENKIKITKSTIGISALYNPSHNLITSSGKLIDECLQAKTSFQYQIRNGKTFPLFWKPGISGFYQRNLTENSDDLKLSCGLQFLCFITSASIVFQMDFSILTGEFAGVSATDGAFIQGIVFSKGTITLKNQWYFPSIQPGIKLSGSFSPALDYSYLKTSENCVLYLSFSENPSVSLSCGATFNQKDGAATGMSADFSGTVKFSWKKVKCTGKVSFTVAN